MPDIKNKKKTWIPIERPTGHTHTLLFSMEKKFSQSFILSHSLIKIWHNCIQNNVCTISKTCTMYIIRYIHDVLGLGIF